jgi:hypothetical protein
VVRGQTLTFTVDEHWASKEMEVKLWHWTPVTLYTDMTSTYSKWDCWGVPTHSIKGGKFHKKYRAELRAELLKRAREWVLIGTTRIPLQSLRQAQRSGTFNLLDADGKPCTDGEDQTQVVLRTHAVGVQPESVEELRDMAARRSEMLAQLAKAYTPVPLAMPFRTVPGSSRTGRRAVSSQGLPEDPSRGPSRVATGLNAIHEDRTRQHSLDDAENFLYVGTFVASGVFEAEPVRVAPGRAQLRNEGVRPRDGHGRGGHGLFYHLGSEGGAKEYRNPAAMGVVRLTASSAEWERGRPQGIFDLEPQPSLSANERESWVCLELPACLRFIPSHYSLRHGLSGPGRRLTDWSLLASHDGRSWLTLRQHNADSSLHNPSEQFAACTYTIPKRSDSDFGVPSAQRRAFVSDEEIELMRECEADALVLVHHIQSLGGLRFFKLQSDGMDSSGSHCLCLSGIELFGDLRVDLPRMIRAAQPPCGMQKNGSRKSSDSLQRRALGSKSLPDRFRALASHFA